MNSKPIMNHARFFQVFQMKNQISKLCSLSGIAVTSTSLTLDLVVHLTCGLVPQPGGDPEQGVGEPGCPGGRDEGHEAGAGGPGAPHHLAVF